MSKVDDLMKNIPPELRDALYRANGKPSDETMDAERVAQEEANKHTTVISRALIEKMVIDYAERCKMIDIDPTTAMANLATHMGDMAETLIVGLLIRSMEGLPVEEQAELYTSVAAIRAARVNKEMCRAILQGRVPT